MSLNGEGRARSYPRAYVVVVIIVAAIQIKQLKVQALFKF